MRHDYQISQSGDSLRYNEKLPENEFSEFAFAGKSNVGKSSLINGLISRKAYARTSAEPGKTQTIRSNIARSLKRR